MNTIYIVPVADLRGRIAERHVLITACHGLEADRVKAGTEVHGPAREDRQAVPACPELAVVRLKSWQVLGALGTQKTREVGRRHRCGIIRRRDPPFSRQPNEFEKRRYICETTVRKLQTSRR